MHRNNVMWCWLFLTPTIILYLLFTGWPLVSGFYFATLDWSGISSSKSFVGWDNFIEVASDSYFWKAFGNSFKFTAGVLPIHVFLGLLIALLLNHKSLRYSTFFRTLFFLPVVTTASIVGIIMIFILASDGPVNFLYQLLPFNRGAIDFLGNVKNSLSTVVVVSGWKNLGTNIVYWLAALQSIPKDLYEAAEIDGCSSPQKFWYITTPLIIPIGAVIALMNIIGSLKAFDMIKTMTDGGPFFSTDVVATYIYRYAFSSELGLPRMGYAAAAGIFFGLTVICIGLISNYLAKKIQGYHTT